MSRAPTCAVIYTRVSQDKFGRKDSVSQQEQELRDLADDEGWSVAEVFSDNDRSASRFATKGRPGFAALRQFVRTHDVDVVAIWEASRLARSMSVAIEFRDMCRERGVSIWFGDTLYDMEKPDHQKAFTDHMSDAEHESAKTSKRIKRSVRARAAAGRPHGKKLFGYRRVYDDDKSLVSVIEEPAQADLLREIADRVLSGETCYAISRSLTEVGIMAPRGGVWHATNITRLLRNPAYAGKVVLRGEIHAEAMWPAIFDDVTWQRLQAVLNDPARNTTANRGVERLLSGIMVCGLCGGRVGTAKQNGGKLPDGTRKSYRVYTCHGRTPTLTDPNPVRFCTARKVEHVDEWVTAVVIERLSRPDAMAAFVASASPDTRLRELAKAIETRRQRLDDYYDSAAKPDGVSAAALARIEAPILAEIASLEGEQRDLATPSALAGIDLPNIEQLWDEWPLRTKRAVVSELFTVTMLPVTKKGTRRFERESIVVAPRSRTREIAS